MAGCCGRGAGATRGPTRTTSSGCTPTRPTVNSRDEKGAPPRTYTFEHFDAAGDGQLPTTVAIDPDKHYDVYTSTVAGNPPMPSESSLSEIDVVAAKQQESLPAKATIFLSRLIARLRGDR